MPSLEQTLETFFAGRSAQRAGERGGFSLVNEKTGSFFVLIVAPPKGLEPLTY
jgi:hypothetical protein